MKVVLDTDIGADVDDCLALAVLLGSPKVELAGTTRKYPVPPAANMEAARRRPEAG